MDISTELGRIASEIQGLSRRASDDLDFNRFIYEVQQIRSKFESERDSRLQEMWIEKLVRYVEGGIRAGYLPRGFASTYKRLTKGLGVTGLSGDGGSWVRGWGKVFDGVVQSAERMHRKSAPVPSGARSKSATIKDVALSIQSMLEALPGSKMEGRPWIKATMAYLKSVKGSNGHGLEVEVTPYRKEFRVQITETAYDTPLEDIITTFDTLDLMVREPLQRLWRIHT